jgi:DNA-directed RNA polymerase subunit RPC12/RpoP
MTGRATGVTVNYKCRDCGEEFSVYQDVDTTDYQITLQVDEIHEDCEG